MANRKRTILLFARTGGGKTSQIGNLAEHIYITTGKHTRLYTGDRGGIDPIRPYVDIGVIELVERGDSNPWIFWNKAVRGYVRDDKGKWVPGKNDNIGMFAFESITSFSDDMMSDMQRKAAAGINIGGGANIAFNAEGDGEVLKVSGSNMAMYQVSQARLMEEVWESQKLNADYILWTAGVSKEDDNSSSAKVLGPAASGRALTPEIPRSFGYTFRLDAQPIPGKGKKHVLYLGTSIDSAAGNAVTLGNSRVPLGAELPISLEPADLVYAFKLIDEAEKKATEAIKKRLEAKSNASK